MKNRIIGIILCVALLITGFTATLFVRQEKGRVHQHLTAAKKADCADHGDEKFCTHLPLVQIETDEDIPGKPVIDKKNHSHERTTAADGSDRIVSTVKITDHDELAARFALILAQLRCLAKN